MYIYIYRYIDCKTVYYICVQNKICTGFVYKSQLEATKKKVKKMFFFSINLPNTYVYVDCRM